MKAPATTAKKVSVIIPVLDTGDLAVKLVLKILKGPYKNLEFILVDDGSHDSSLELLKEFKRQYDLKSKNSPTRLEVLHEENAGPSAARNLGLKKATGEYVCFIDSDDSVAPDFIAKLVAAIEQYDEYGTSDLRPALASSAVEYTRVATGKVSNLYTKPATPQLPDEDFKTFILRLISTDGRLYAVNNKLFRRSIITHFNLTFDEKINFAEDTKFVLDYLAAASRVKFRRLAFVLDPLYLYNYGTATSIVTLSSLSWGSWEKSFQNLAKWTGKNPTKTQIKLLRKVRRHWRLSHALAVARSSQSFGHKCQHASPALVIPALLIVKFRR